MNEIRKDIDRLIDSAIAKDKDLIPKLPTEPDSALLSGLKSPAPSLHSGLISGSMIKIAAGLFSVAAIGIVAYINYSPKATEQPMQPRPIIAVSDSLKKGHTDTISKSRALGSTQSVQKNTPDQDSFTQGERNYHAGDLLAPEKSSRIKSDSIAVPIKH